MPILLADVPRVASQDDLALLRVDLVHRHRQLRIVRVRDEQDVQPVRADVALVVADVALRRKARIRYRVGQLCRIGRVEESGARDVVWRSVWVMVPAAALEHLRRPRGGGRDRDAGHGVVAPRARLGGASQVELRPGVHPRAVVEARVVAEVGHRGHGSQRRSDRSDLLHVPPLDRGSDRAG